MLCRAGYLDVFDHLYTYGDEIEWRLEFVSAYDYTISYRKVGTTTWNPDGTGSRDEFSVSNSMAVYILPDWWDPCAVTVAGYTVTFQTKPSPNMIELPVLFWDAQQAQRPGAVAYTNNVVNSLVDGNKVVFAYVQGPAAQNHDLFNWYVFHADDLVGFTGSTGAIEERVYHNGFGSIHCGTNVLRQIPSVGWWENL